MRILAVDDDDVTLALVQAVLPEKGITVEAYSSRTDALEALAEGEFDLVLSDYFMPGMTATEFLERAREIDEDVAFVFLTVNEDVETAAELMKSGADDYIRKPVNAPELEFRIRKTIADRETARRIEQVERENELLALESKQLANWRTLYAGKDTAQMTQLINRLEGMVGESGGFDWLDQLKAGATVTDDGCRCISDELFDRVIASGEAERGIFSFLVFMGTIDTLLLNMVEIAVSDFCSDLSAFLKTMIDGMPPEHHRQLVISAPTAWAGGKVRVDMHYVREVMRELLLNALKYSPPDSRVVCLLGASGSESTRRITIEMRNTGADSGLTDAEGRPVVGVPYDYSEKIFDMFYTMQPASIHLPGEQWPDGTGLFIARRLVMRFGGWISVANGIDYTGDEPAVAVTVTLALPVTE